MEVLDLGDDPAAGAAGTVGVLTHRAVDLGGEHDVVAAALQRLADDLLRLAARVDVGGVDEVDPRIERAVDHPDALVLVGVAGLAEHHGPQAVRADLDTSPTERAQLHVGFTLISSVESPRTDNGRCRRPGR